MVLVLPICVLSFIDWAAVADVYQQARADYHRNRLDRIAMEEFGAEIAQLEARYKQEALTRERLKRNGITDIGLTLTSAGTTLGRDDFRCITRVSCVHGNPSNHDLQPLQDAVHLRRLSLQGCRKITDEALLHLKNCRQLDTLSLHSTQVSDDGIRLLTQFSELRWLCLAHTKVTDEGLLQLAEMAELTYLDVRASQVTEVGVIRFQDAIHPRQCNIERRG